MDLDSSLPLVQWVRRMAGQQVDLVVRLITAWAGRDPSLVVPATARHLYKVSTWYLVSVDRKTDISSLLDLVIRSVIACCLEHMVTLLHI